MKQQDNKKMRALYDQWLLSGQNKSIFSNRHGLRLSTFSYWIKKFQTLDDSPTTNSNGFNQIAVQGITPAVSGQAVATINFPSGIRVDLCFPVSALYLKELIA